MTTNTSAHDPQGPASLAGVPPPQSAAGRSDPIQELLDGVTALVEARRAPTSSVHSLAPGSRGNEQANRSMAIAQATLAMEAADTAQASLERIVDRIRAQFRLLADLEIRRALERALDAIPDPALGPTVTETADGGTRPTQQHATAGAEWPSTPHQDGPSTTADARLFEGTVRLVVPKEGSIQRVVQFVDDLCRQPQVRLLRMSGGPQYEGTEISIGLREPLAIVELLQSMGYGAAPEDRSAMSGLMGERSVVVTLASSAGA